MAKTVLFFLLIRFFLIRSQVFMDDYKLQKTIIRILPDTIKSSWNEVDNCVMLEKYQINKNKMSLSPSLRKFQANKAKSLLKQAIKRRPISIQSLKKSLFINQSNLDGFVKYVREDSGIFPTSNLENVQKPTHQMQTELIGLRNIVKNINCKASATKDIFLKRKSVKSKQMKKQLKIQRSQLKLQTETPNQSYSLRNIFNKTKTNWCLDNLKQKKVAIDVRSSKIGNRSAIRSKKYLNNTFSTHNFTFQSENQTPNSTKLYRKSDKLSSNRRWKTQQDLKSVEKNLSQMTKYCEKKHLKGINYLVLQLHLNVQGSKQMRKTTGPFY